MNKQSIESAADALQKKIAKQQEVIFQYLLNKYIGQDWKKRINEVQSRCSRNVQQGAAVEEFILDGKVVASMELVFEDNKVSFKLYEGTNNA
jgi:hypothetical protein